MSNSTDTFAPEVEKHYGRFGRLYHGLTTIDFVGRRKIWFTVSLVIILLGLGSLAIRGFNLGIDFKGGSSWEVLAPKSSITQMTNAVKNAGLSNPTVEKLGSDTYQVTADINNLSGPAQAALTTKVVDAMAAVAHTSDFQVSTSSVGPTWGGQITNKAIEALVVFFIAVVAYISIRFEPKMAAAAFIAMVHDLLVTVGVYSLFGFQITPDTVIAILTILGYSLYDTVVVFDRVRDNTQGVLKSGELTYSDMVNLSMNQTLARSINTSLVAILPVLAVLLIGADLLGATTLQDYGLALFVGLIERGVLLDLHRQSVARVDERARASLPRFGGARDVSRRPPRADRDQRGPRRSAGERGGSRPPPARAEAPPRPSKHALVSGNAVNAPVG